MLPNKKIATEVMPPVLVAITLLLLVGRTVSGIYERHNPVQCQDLVNWQPPSTAMEESRKTGKPVFLFFTATYKPAKDLEYKRNYFSDPKIAAEINENFIPAKVVDQYYAEDPREDPLVQEMESKYLQWYTLPAIHVVPTECQKIQLDRYRLPHFYSIEFAQNHQQMYRFIDEYKDWHPLPHSPSEDTKWTKIKDAKAVSAMVKQPILYFFARHNDNNCNEAMTELFTKGKCSHEILKKYVCCMVYDHSALNKANTPDVDLLLKKFKVTTFPTFVVDKGGNFSPTDKVTGYHGHETMEEFLATTIKDSASKN